jgi:putative MATE family efflux protein
MAAIVLVMACSSCEPQDIVGKNVRKHVFLKKDAKTFANPVARKAMTDGTVGKKLFQLTLPVAWGTLSFLGFRVAEALFLGRLGPQALAAVTFSFNMTMVVTSLAIGLGAGSSSVIARALGAGEAGVARLVADALVLTFLVGVAAAIVGVVLAAPLARVLGADAALAPLVASYLRWWFPSAILILVAQVGLSAARAAGDATFQGTAMLGCSLLNLAAAPIMILGIGPFRGFGLDGAPMANAIAWAPLLVATFWRLRQLHILSFHADGGRAGIAGFLDSTRRILRVGAPAAATNTVIPLSAAVITRLLAGYGHDAVAGFGIGTRVESLAMVAFFALSAVMNPFAGQNFGAGRLDRVRTAMRVTVIFCLSLGLALALALGLGAPWIAAQFTPNRQVETFAISYLTLVPVSYGAAGIIAIVNAAFNGLGRPMSAVTISVARTLVVNVPVAWLGGKLFGAPGVFLGIGTANLVVGAGSAGWIFAATRHPRTAHGDAPSGQKTPDPLQATRPV